MKTLHEGLKWWDLSKENKTNLSGGKEHPKENGCEMMTYKGNFTRIKWGDKWKGKA